MMNKAQHILWILFLCLISSFNHSSAQSINGFLLRNDIAQTIEGDQSIEDFIKSYFKQEKKLSIELVEKQLKKTAHSSHYLYEQTFKRLPIEGCFVKINLNLKGEITSIAYELRDVSQLDFTQLIESADIQKAYAQVDEKFIRNKVEKVFFDEYDKPYLGVQFDFFKYDSLINKRYIFYNNKIQSITDRNVYFRDTTIQVKVFNPDPITSLKSSYGNPIKDFNDSAYNAINAEQVLLNITSRFDESSKKFLLQNKSIKMVDKNAPQNSIPQLSANLFDFNRHQSEFESVNAFYHLSQFQKHIQSIGYGYLTDTLVEIDAQGKLDDNSAFVELFGEPLLIGYGIGGVDDAEDADVIVHEYCHYLSFQAAPYTNIGNQRKSLDEGIADYFAAMYSKNINEYRWNDLFTWDGNNEYWQGRQMVNHLKYPNDTTTSIHRNGTIWAGMMVEINAEIGREIAEKNLLQSLFSYFPNMKMTDAGSLLLEADDLLYAGKHRCILEKHLRNRGLFPNSISGNCYNPALQFDPAITSNEVCKLDSIGIGVSIVNPSSTIVSYNWLPSTFLNNSYVSNPIFFGDSAMTYSVTIYDVNGKMNRKNITISVKNCNTEVQMLNTNGFILGAEKLKIRLPDSNTDNFSLKVFDLLGKELLSMDLPNYPIYYLPYSSIPNAVGMLIISVFKDGKPQASIKVIK